MKGAIQIKFVIIIIVITVFLNNCSASCGNSKVGAAVIMNENIVKHCSDHINYVVKFLNHFFHERD